MLVGQEPAPSKCVLLSASGGVRKGCLGMEIGGRSSLMSGILVVTWTLPFGVGLLPLLPEFGWSSPVWFLSLLFLLDFHGIGFHRCVRVIRSMFIPAALDASLLASHSLRRLRSSIHKVIWSRRQQLASVGAVLGLMYGPSRWDPAYCVVWFRFRTLRRYLALWLSEVGRVYWSWSCASSCF